MSSKYLFAFCLLAAFILAACSKHEKVNPIDNSKKDTNVYVAGSTIAPNGYVEATYWKNGTPVILHPNTPGKLTPSTAAAVAIQGHDVYFAGNTSDNGYFIATVWKNGIESYLPSNDPYSDTTGIFVSGDDVYVSGFSYTSLFEPTYTAKLWKNGIAVDLEYATNSTAVGVFVSGDDVYVAGSIGSPTGTSAVYWKNGKAVILNSGNILAAGGNSIYVDGTDVYVAGSAVYGPGDIVGKPSVATYWKNGDAITLGDPSHYSAASFITIHKGDVHVLGTLTIDNLDQPVYWKNGAAQPGASYSPFSAIIFDSDDEAYFLGQAGGFGYYVKNGTGVKLAGNGDGGSFGYAMTLSAY